MTPLAETYRAAGGTACDDLERLLEEAVANGRSAWPNIGGSAEELVRYLARVRGEEGDLDSVHGDLWLARAILDGDQDAVGELHRLCGRVGARALPSVKLDAAAQQEVVQRVETRLVTGTDTTPPALGNYRGHGSLKSWLRVALIREALRLRKAADVERPFEDGVLQTLAIEAGDPETELLKDHYLTAFRAAFRQALSELSARERNLLRYLVIENMAVEEVAGLYNVNRSTLWRWMGAIRESLLRRTRKLLRTALGISDPELDSIMRLIHSRLTATLSALAASETA